MIPYVNLLDPRPPAADGAALVAEVRAAGCTPPIAQSTLYRVSYFMVKLG